MKGITIFFLSCICACVLLFSSCVNTHKITYFNNTADSVFPATDGLEPVIQKGDILSVSVSSLSPEVTNVFNVPNAPAGNSYGSESALTEAVGYLVSQEGYIDFPMLGSIGVAGLTKEALKDSITKTL